MQEEKDTIGLRVYVKGGGCHGYQYGMAFESKMGDDDTVIEKGDVKVHHGFAKRSAAGRLRSRLPGQRARLRLCDQEPTSQNDVWVRQFIQRITSSPIAGHRRR